MKNKTKVILLTVAFAQDAESGATAELPVPMLEETADSILKEQEKCELCQRGGAVQRLISAYAELVGYEDGFFIHARAWRGI